MSEDQPPKPLVSTRADDPNLAERIDAFVVALGEIVDTLQDAQAQGSWALLEQQSEALAAQSSELGYPPMAEAAARIVRACTERNPETAFKAVAEVTELAGRVRRGHRSAA